MSGCSSNMNCPNCNKNMDIYSDYKPFDCVSGQCFECGFHYETVSGYYDLETLNEFREERRLDYDDDTMKPLKKLPEQQPI